MIREKKKTLVLGVLNYLKGWHNTKKKTVKDGIK